MCQSGATLNAIKVGLTGEISRQTNKLRLIAFNSFMTLRLTAYYFCQPSNVLICSKLAVDLQCLLRIGSRTGM
jgi:hypothetical protein